ncbi:MAG: xanthine dehydrogenase family protein [Candidatus Tectomicrobia bacterium]|uniref:Xanthine dehydrogenase family protein n=1 Tax=Tectimicrobiota bacterium TaxID=2528274 RepID=A0A932GMN0_UNCTE|nr:xanthine dehydrogenase family protein [Candidatus Tectomicrobia bacterium]
MLHAVFFRSPYPHARIKKVWLDGVLKLPGVVAAFSGESLPELIGPMAQIPLFGVERTLAGNPAIKYFPHLPLARDKARYVGEPVAVVAATDKYLAEDALEAVEADFEPLPPVIDAEQTLERPEVLLYEDWGDNVLMHYTVSGGDVEKAFREADRILEITVPSSRFTGTPIEPRSVVARYDPHHLLLEVWDTTQCPHLVGTWIERAIRIPGLKTRVTVSRLGGGFGPKVSHYPEEIVVPYLAIQTGRPVRWVETRSEHLVGTTHGREQIHRLQVAVKSDGRVLGIRDRIVADMGGGHSWTGLSSIMVSALYVPGTYRIENYSGDLYGVVTNKTPFGAHRGFGKAEAAYVIERVMDSVARELGQDPIEIRKRNFIPPEAFPYRNATGSRYDSGQYAKTLDKALDLLNYSHWRAEQTRLRREGRYVGIGVSVVLEPTSSNRRGAGGYYSVRMRMDPTGTIYVFLSGNDDGTGHALPTAQIVADELAVDVINVHVVEGDSLMCPYGTGSYSSRFGGLGGAAVMLAARQLREKILEVGAALLGETADRLVLSAGSVRVRSAGEKQIALNEVARAAYTALYRLPEGMEPGLELIYHYRDPNVTFLPDERGRVGAYSSFPYAVDAGVVEVDVETGSLTILKYVSVHDCGNQINPKEVEGQHLGSLAHGLGGALYEELLYDSDGQLLTQNFKDYLIPTALDLPPILIGSTVTPNPFTPGGFKGAGEAGAVGPPPCLVAAVEDALAPLGVRVRTLPLKPSSLWELIREHLDRVHSEGGKA